MQDTAKMRENKAFNFGRDFQKIADDYSFKELAAFVTKGDQSGKYDFYKLKPLFDKYGYKETIAAISAAVKNSTAAVVETRPAVESSEVVTR